MRKPIARRGFLTLGAVTGFSVPLAAVAEAGAAAAGAAPANALLGRVLKVGGGSLSLETVEGVIAVQATADASLYVGAFGRVDDLDQFVEGDRVLAQGSFADGYFLAHFVGSAYIPQVFTVLGVRSGAVVRTSGGDINVRDGDLPDKRVRGRARQVAVGETLEGLFWTDPRDSITYYLPASA